MAAAPGTTFRCDGRLFHFHQSIGADFPGAVGANAPIGKGSVGACTQRKN